jgi:FkbM family methyltransferase
MMQTPSRDAESGLRAWFHHLWPAVNTAVERYSSHAAVFGYTQAASRLLFGRRAARRAQRVEAMLPGTDIPLTLRLGTSDVDVFREIFVNLEYGWVFNSPPRVIVDVGGYTGLSAAFFAHTYPDAVIITIEPDPRNFEVLKLNTARFPNVHAVNAAVWRESGTIWLTDPGRGAWGLQVSKSHVGAQDHDGTRAITVDEIMKEFDLDRIDLLKVDVEGSETEIFDTSSSWLPFVDVICIELHDRFKVGCSRSFYKAVEEFPIEIRRNEDVLVARASSPLVPLRAVH